MLVDTKTVKEDISIYCEISLTDSKGASSIYGVRVKLILSSLDKEDLYFYE
jgi:hypothetical protein